MRNFGLWGMWLLVGFGVTGTAVLGQGRPAPGNGAPNVIFAAPDSGPSDVFIDNLRWAVIDSGQDGRYRVEPILWARHQSHAADYADTRAQMSSAKQLAGQIQADHRAALPH